MRERALGADNDRGRRADEWARIDVTSITIGGADRTASKRFIAPDDENPSDETVMSVPLAQPIEAGAGVTIEVIKRDDTSTPEVGKRLAQELITRNHVQLLFGVVASPVAAAIAPLTAEAKVPLIITNAAGTAITRISPYVVRVSFTQWHTALPMGQWAVKQGWKKAFIAVSDFIPGHDAEGAFTKGFTDAGGQIVGSIAFSPAFRPF